MTENRDPLPQYDAGRLLRFVGSLCQMPRKVVKSILLPFVGSLCQMPRKVAKSILLPFAASAIELEKAAKIAAAVRSARLARKKKKKKLSHSLTTQPSLGNMEFLGN